MKILHFHTALEMGGVEALLCGLANEMTKKHDITVCTIYKPKESDVFYKRLSNKIHFFSCNKTQKGFSLKELFSIYKIIQSGEYDIVQLHGFMYYYLFAIIMLHRKTHFVYTVHNDAIRENSKWDRMIFPIKRFLFKSGIVKVVTISNASQDCFSALYKAESKLIYNGIHAYITNNNSNRIIDTYRINKKTEVFIHAGRITPQKNQGTICKVFQRLIQEEHDIVLLIAGTIDDKAAFNNLRHFFCKRIVYIGEQSDVPQLLSQCDAMCMNSIYEGMPIVVLEALSVGCISICSPVGGIVNVIKDGETGFLSESSSEEDYYKCMKRFLATDKKTISKMKENCKKAFTPFDIKNTANNYLEFYESLINNK